MTTNYRPVYPPSELELSAIYLRLAAAYRRMEQRLAARPVSAERLPLPVDQGQSEHLTPSGSEGQDLPASTGGTNGGSRRGPYRRRPARPAGFTEAGHA